MISTEIRLARRKIHEKLEALAKERLELKKGVKEMAGVYGSYRERKGAWGSLEERKGA